MKTIQDNHTYKKIKYGIDHDNLKNYIALGFFDGIHLGHQALLKCCVKEARLANATSTAILFDEHPEKVIKNYNHFYLLTTLEERIRRIRQLGLQQIIIINFNENFQKITAENFIIKILLKKFNMRAVFVGYNYSFGFQKKGDIKLIKELSNHYNFKSYIMKPETIDEKQKISTTIIKENLIKGNIEKANKLLGYPYELNGEVIHGDNRGSTVLSFPTANLALAKEKMLPKNGVYIAFAYSEGKKYNGLVNVGFRPTFRKKKDDTSVEIYIFDFCDDIYNKKISISLLKRIRDEKRFTHARDLAAQIKKDKIIAENFFKEYKNNLS